MVTKLILDKAGRLVLPKPVRDELQLVPGDSLELESTENQIVLRPVRGTMPLLKEKGVWVFRCGAPVSDDEIKRTLREVRQERDRVNLGKKH